MRTNLIATGFILILLSFLLPSCYTSRYRRVDRREYRRVHHHRSHGYDRGYYRY